MAVYPHDSTCNVVISGHGIPGGGIRFGSNDLTPATATSEGLGVEIGRVLKPGGGLTLLGCNLGEPGNLPGVQQIADDWDLSIKVNTGCITYFGTEVRNRWTRELLYTTYTHWEGVGDWVCVEPTPPTGGGGGPVPVEGGIILQPRTPGSN